MSLSFRGGFANLALKAAANSGRQSFAPSMVDMFCLRCVGADDVHIQLTKRPAKLGHAIAGFMAGRGCSKDAVFVGVERHSFPYCAFGMSGLSRDACP